MIEWVDKGGHGLIITGVTRFNKVSIFSDLNQLNDISMVPEYAAVCGITEDEITRFLSPKIRQFALDRELSFEKCRQLLREYYDGYHFAASADGRRLAQRRSIIRTACSRRFKTGRWVHSGFLPERRHF